MKLDLPSDPETKAAWDRADAIREEIIEQW